MWLEQGRLCATCAPDFQSFWNNCGASWKTWNNCGTPEKHVRVWNIMHVCPCAVHPLDARSCRCQLLTARVCHFHCNGQVYLHQQLLTALPALTLAPCDPASAQVRPTCCRKVCPECLCDRR
jgi:hypothetical protein